MLCVSHRITSSLTLFVPGIRTNDTNHPFASDHFAVAADFLNRSTYFHSSIPILIRNNLYTARGLFHIRKVSFEVARNIITVADPNDHGP